MTQVSFDLDAEIVNADEVIATIKNDITFEFQTFIQDWAQKILEDILRKQFPANTKTPSGYIRTGEMAQAVAGKVTRGKNRITLEVYIDSNKLSMYEVENSLFNVHMSVDGKDFRQALPGVLDEGSSGSPFYNHPAHNFTGRALEIYNNQISSILANRLSAYGYDVTII